MPTSVQAHDGPPGIMNIRASLGLAMRANLQSALWTVADQVADESRASPDGGQVRAQGDCVPTLCGQSICHS